MSRDEALRVLETCMMDETMAIERILSGNGLNSWSQVSKKKKPPQSRSTNRVPHHNPDRDRNQGRRDRRDRDRSGSLPGNSDQSNSQSNGYRRPGGSTRHFQSHPQSNRNRGQSSTTNSGRTRTPLVQSSGQPQASASNRAQQIPTANAAAGSSQPVSSWSASNVAKSSETAQTWGSPPREGWREGQDVDTSKWESQEPQAWGDAPTASANETLDEPWSESLHSSSPSQPRAWGAKDPLEKKDRNTDSTSKNDLKNTSDTSQSIDPPQKPPNKSPQKPMHVSSVKRTFNYAAAAAAGTSHEKPVHTSSPERSTTSAQQDSTKEDVSVNEKMDDSANIEPTKSNQHTPAVSSPVNRPISSSEHTVETGNDANSAVLAVSSVPNLSPVPSASPLKVLSPNPVSQPSNADALTSPLPTKQENALDTPNRTSAWSSRPSLPESKKEKLEDTSAAVAAASAAVVGNEAAGEDALSLQFGSFGLGGLDVSWTPPLPKLSEPVGGSVLSASQSNVSTVANSSGSTPNVSSAPAPVASPQGNNLPVVASTTSVMPSNSVAPPPPPAAPAPTTAVPSNLNVGSSLVSGTSSTRAHDNGPMLSNHPDPRANTLSSSALHLPNVSSTGSGSGVYSVLAMPGPGASFAPANYGAPYLVPPLHGYSPALVPYGDNTNDLNSSRGPSLGPPGSLPLYDPNLPVMGSGNGKYGAIPGLGDMSTLGGMQTGVGKEGLHSNPEMEKGNGLGGTSGLGNGMDPLAAPYMLPGYPSMQYPMYTFPSPPYGPPGMAPPGANPFPYAAAGQVTSQGGRGFGFDDGVGLGANSRNGAGLGESMYTPGGYLTNGNPKGGADGSYKPGRGNNGGGLSGMGMGGGMMVGMGYGDYAGVMGGVGNNVGGGGSGGAGWGHRHANGMRDGNGNSGMMSNGAMGNNVGPGAGGGYGGGAGNAAGGSIAGGNAGGSGYWTGQASGYYS